MEKEQQKKIINRLRRIEGQLRGLEKLVEKGSPCIDILTQVSAVTSAVKKTGTEIIRLHLDECLGETCRQPEKDRKAHLEEFQKVMARYIDMA